MRKMDKDQKALIERLDYDPETGLFKWRAPNHYQARGWFKGSKSLRHYRRIKHKSRLFMAHSVAWAIMTGEWPVALDHRNRDQDDNRWSNLRKATQAQNSWNRGRSKHNTTGARGVSHYGELYRAAIRKDGRFISLGLFDTVEAAYAARLRAEREHYGSFAPM